MTIDPKMSPSRWHKIIQHEQKKIKSLLNEIGDEYESFTRNSNLEDWIRAEYGARLYVVMKVWSDIDEWESQITRRSEESS